MKNKTATPAQLNARNRFRDAAKHAKRLLQDPEQKRYYTEQARKQNLPNAYTAAVTEYLRTNPLVKITGSLQRKVKEPAKRTEAIKYTSPTKSKRTGTSSMPTVRVRQKPLHEVETESSDDEVYRAYRFTRGDMVVNVWTYNTKITVAKSKKSGLTLYMD